MGLTADPADVLLTFAEVAVAFAGFSSIVGIFQRESRPDHGSFDLFRFWVMLEFSLAALFFSLLPFPLHFFGVSDAAVWSVGSVALILFILWHGISVRYLTRRREPAVVSSLTRGLSVVANVAFGAIVVSQLLSLGGVLGPAVGAYLFGVFILLFGAGLNFVRLVWVGTPPLSR